MKHTLLTICLIVFALPSWGQTTFSGGNIRGGNVSSSNSMETEYKIFDGLPCKFFGAEIGAINRNATLGDITNRCSHHKGYSGKIGASVYAKRGTTVVAPTDMKLIKTVNKTAEMNCKGLNESQQELNINENNCQMPFDDLHAIFDDKSGNQFYFYHLLEDNPMVPGYGNGNCKTPKLFGTEKHKRWEYNCGGVKKRNFKKGEIIGYVGQTGIGLAKSHWNGQHMSFAVKVINHPSFPNQKGWIVPTNELKWENIASDNLLIYLFPIKNPSIK